MEKNFKRVLSCFTDHIVLTGVTSIIVIPGILIEVLRNPFELAFPTGNIFFNTLALSIYLCKDVFFKSSVGKTIFKLKLVKSGSLLKPSSFQCFFRNVTFFTWPLEVLILLASPEQRLGDKLAKTRVIGYPEGVDVESSSSIGSKLVTFIASLLLSYLFMLVFEMIVDFLNHLVA